MNNSEKPSGALSMANLLNEYRKLDDQVKTLLQCLAFSRRERDFYFFYGQAAKLEFVGSNGKRITQKSIKEMMTRWVTSGLVGRNSGQINAAIRDIAIRDGFQSNKLYAFLDIAEEGAHWGTECDAIDLAVALYQAQRKRIC